MKILLTGGHLSPLLAVLDELIKSESADIYVISRKRSMEGVSVPSFESEVLKTYPITLAYLTTGRLQRHVSFHTLLSLAKIPVGFLQSVAYLWEIRPDVVVSFGGYLSVPVVVSAWLLGIPSVTHEQSVRAGLANRINRFFSRRILVSWESSLPFFPTQKTIVTGNPIRSAIFVDDPKDKEIVDFLNTRPQKPLLYITGGNQGSHVINETVFACLPKLIRHVSIIHQVGRHTKDLEQARHLLNELPDHFRAQYLPLGNIGDADIGAVFASADLVIGRSGANTVTEVAALGLPALFIPLPWAQQDEQTENAKLLVQVGTAAILPQNALKEPKLTTRITDMLANIGSYKANSGRAKMLVQQQAAKTIAKIILQKDGLAN